MIQQRRPKIRRLLRRLASDTSGLALLEFAFSLPILLALSLSGAELTNFVITRMRVSQLALHIADNAARIGSGTQLEAKKITEADINDLLIGAGLQANDLKLFDNGRVIISSIEPDPAHEGKSMIRWQRCKGAKTAWTSSIGAARTDNKTGFGPAGRQVSAPEDVVVIFVDVRYQYTPLIETSISPATEIHETASMMVRDRRDTGGDEDKGSAATHPYGIYKVDGVVASTC
ncbi:MAG: pilus assembly protein [Sphingomonas sp.]|uniref:TadE/TadG family type IV pilus assembly protein n=1 Tax=Sphingomonas sp. TaxID=28214 RepID=UPI001B015451|nr:pilus assembly protein [Sphingomonas sp.]MBO9622798.1 pilus assembly protein [Sphingomonas sp.]